ncbi:dipicolinic acid synthetase B subunit [Clostridium sp. CAG:575]|mgnify:FL=1|nr:dipicolinic acid synthetase B subunit [Clostridium sp. CAG:575]
MYILDVKDKKIGYVLTGSFCTFSKTIPKMKELIDKGADIIPIMSYNSYKMDTKFGKAQDFINKIETITGKKIIHTIQGAEPIGPKALTDIMIVAPCSGNTMAKLACDIIDTPATMAVKSHLRNNLPVVIAPSTNNGLGANAVNIANLLNRKNYYFVPFRQDNPITKPRSIVFDSEYIIKTIEYALDNEQIEPILL